jgi:hypothetical protein
MAKIVKRLSAPYELVAVNNGPTQFTVGSASTNNAVVTINGNLFVTGNTTVVDSNITVIHDNIITLNAGGNIAAVGQAGIEVDRTVNKVSLVWSEPLQKWVIAVDGVVTNEIALAPPGSGSFLTKVFDDKNPFLGNNLNINGFTLTSNSSVNVVIAPGTNGNAQVNSAMQLQQISALTTPVSGYSLIAAGVPSGGATGLYVTNSVSINQELITKTKAVLYSLIF